ncbi:lysozyme [Roseovarius sp.]
MKITPRVAMEIASHEAVVRQAYRDSVGVWTWGVGITSASGHNVEQYIDKPQSLTTCLNLFISVLDRYADDVREVFAGYNLTEAEFAAALSFHWNTGAIKRASWVKHWKAGDRRIARKRFMDWKRPPEIIGRRKAEAALMFDGVWSNKGTMPEYTRLRANYSPDWSSRVERDVWDYIKALLDHPPASKPAAPVGGLLAALMAFLKSIFGGKQ